MGCPLHGQETAPDPWGEGPSICTCEVVDHLESVLVSINCGAIGDANRAADTNKEGTYVGPGRQAVGYLEGMAERDVVKQLSRPSRVTPADEEYITKVLLAAREVQEYLWGDAHESGLDFEVWKDILGKRIHKLAAIDFDKPHAVTELRKRLLQTAGVAVAWLVALDRDAEPTQHSPGEPTSYSP